MHIKMRSFAFEFGVEGVVSLLYGDLCKSCAKVDKVFSSGLGFKGMVSF